MKNFILWKIVYVIICDVYWCNLFSESLVLEIFWGWVWIGFLCCGLCGGDIGRYLILIDVFYFSFGRKILFGCYKVKNSMLGLEWRIKLFDR